MIDYDYDYDDVEDTQPPIELARKRLEDFVTNWGDGELMDVRGGNGDYESIYPLHTRDIGAVLGTLDRVCDALDAMDGGGEDIGPSENLRFYLAVASAVRSSRHGEESSQQ